MNGFLKAGLVSVSALTLGLITAGTASADTTVVVESGDTLNKIARDYNTTVDKLAADNAIKNVNLIYVGDKLDIKSGTVVQVAPTTVYSQVSTPTNSQPAPAPIPAAATPAPAPAPAPAPSVASSSSRDLLVNRESGGSYTAQNGRYYGKYQLDISYLHGDLSAANQDATAEKYVANRYHSWDNAWAHSQATGWY